MIKIRHKISVFALVVCLSHLAKAQKTSEYNNATTLFERAKMLYIKKQYLPAINTFNKYLASKPGPNFSYASKAYIGLARLKLEKQGASRELSKIIRSELNHSLNTAITYELGIYHFNKENFARSLKYFEQIEEVNIPKSQRGELAFKQGYAYFKNNEYQMAKGQFKKVMNGGGKYAVEANYYFGYQCYILKDYACAIATFNKIGNKGPKTMKLYLAQIFYEQEEYENAFDVIKNVSLAKRKNEIQLLTGKIHYQLGNMSLAKSHFDKYNGDVKSLRSEEIYQFANANFNAKDYKKSTQYFILISNEDNAIGQAANYHIGVADVNIGQKERALNAFAEAKRKDYDHNISDIAAFSYAKRAAELQKNALGIGALKDYLDKYPDSKNRNAAKSMMVDIFLSTKNYKAAIDILEEIGSLTDDSKKAYQELTFHRGEELYLNNQYQDADVFFKKSLKYTKDSKLEALSYFWRAEIAYKVDDNDASINLMNRFMSSSDKIENKNKIYSYYALGYNYFKKNDYPKAQNYFAKFKQLETFSTANKDLYLDNTQRLADCYFLNGQYNQAIEEYNFIIKNNYKNSDYAIFQQGMLLGLQGRHNEKINVLKQISTDFPKSIYVDDALYQTAREYMNTGNYSTAENLFNIIISQHDYSPFLPESYLKLGLISYNQSKDDAALRYYKTVVDRFQNTKESKESLSFIEIIYTNQGKPNEYFEYAKNIAGAGITLSYQDSVIYEQAMLTYNSENYYGASKELDGYINKFGNNGSFIIAAHYFKAECDFYTDKEDIALTHYDYVASRGTNIYTEKSLIKLSSTYFYRKEYAKAIDYYSRLELIAASKSIFLKAIMGQMRAHYLQKEYDKAKKKAIQLLPIQAVPKEDLVKANMILGKVQLKDSNLRSARFHFDYVIENSRNKKTAEALYTRALINFEEGYLDSARVDVYRLQEDFSAYEFWVVKGFILLSDIYENENDLFQAKATLQSIIDNYDKEDDGLLDNCSLKLSQIKEMESLGDAPQGIEQEEIKE